MERKKQLSNVAFGGAWSEQIAGREEQAAAIARVVAAAGAAAWVDPLSVETKGAVDLLCSRHPKGPALREAWIRAGRLDPPGRRVQELKRIADLLASAYAALKT